MAVLAVPDDVRVWIRERGWAMHHLEWHTERRWDILSGADRAWAEQRGWRRAPRQEGAPGNGYDFLIMHRAMIGLLRSQFPAQADYFRGWTAVPTNPQDETDPLPGGANTPFAESMSAAVEKLANHIDSFASEDDLGLFIETQMRPTDNNPFAQSTDASTGIHNYIHSRFSDRTSPVDMGQPQLNLENSCFWRLHGWIDNCWTRLRQSKNLSDDNPKYVEDLTAAQAHLRGQVHGGTHALAAVTVIPAIADIPESISSPFRKTLAGQFNQLMATNPEPTTVEELQSYLQLAIKLEHFTLPLYLTAMWSLKPGPTTTGQARILKDVAMQEMVHMALCCNILVALGGTPKILDPQMLPQYPAVLPGMRNTRIFGLEAFSRAQIERFLEIEMPEHGPLALESVVKLPTATFKTIGDFYDAIDSAFVKLDALHKLPPFITTGQRQYGVVQENDLFLIRNVADARRAIQIIKEQGEGTSTSQGATDVDGSLAHYYAFNQIVRQMRYIKSANGTFTLDPAQLLPLPPAEQILPMAPVPAGGYPGFPQADKFDEAYSTMLEKLQEAWEHDSDDALMEGIMAMPNLSLIARNLMKTPISPGGTPTYGPAFNYRRSQLSRLESAASVAAFDATVPLAAAPPLATVPGYTRIRQILDDAVNNQNIGGHGAFWRTLSRDEFVAKMVFGRKLISTRPDGSFDPDESNLVKALEGRAPFGKNLPAPPPGAIFNQMPDGFSPVPTERINEIRAWISGGCPNVPTNNAPFIVAIEPLVESASVFDHGAFWREFDDWSMFNAAPEVTDDINAFFGAADAWMVFAQDKTQQSVWTAALADAKVRQAVTRLGARQLKTVSRHYGRPAALASLFESFEAFGKDSLPNDPLRPVDVRHRMNGAVMWFYWSAFCDASLRLAGEIAAIPTADWLLLSRAILLGLLNDGVFRERYKVNGFTADASGATDMRRFVQNLPDGQVVTELAKRFAES